MKLEEHNLQHYGSQLVKKNCYFFIDEILLSLKHILWISLNQQTQVEIFYLSTII
jgi:hypothetical protein